MQLFGEYMIVYYYPLKKKVKGYKKSDAYPSVRALNSCLRLAKASSRDTIMRITDVVNDYDLLSHYTLARPPVISIEESDKIKNGATSDTIPGKYWPACITTKSPNIYRATYDYLCDAENHTYTPGFLKIFGLTADFSTKNFSYAYQPSENGRYGLDNFLYATLNMSYTARGKWIKKLFMVDRPITVNTYVEWYPVETTYLTIDEYKEMRKDNDPIKFDKGDIASDDFPAAAPLLRRLNTDN